MKKWSIIIMITIGVVFSGVVTADPIPTMGSCIQTSDPQSGTITVLYCGPPNTISVFVCDPNDTPPVTPNCACPMEDPISVYIPLHCEQVDEVTIDDLY